MTAPIGRYLAARAAVGAAVAILLALPVTGAPPVLAPALLGFAAATTAGALLARRAGAGGRAVLLACLVLDLAAEAVLVAGTGASQSPFVLLFGLTIAATGFFFGLAGGLGVALGASVVYWGGILRFGVGSGLAATMTGVFLLLLGVLAGVVGRRAQAQKREMDRVRHELERVRLDAETIVGSLSSPLLCLDREGEIRRANLPAVRLLGLVPAPEGQRLAEAAPQERLASLLDLVVDVFERGEVRAEEIELPRASDGGMMPVEIVASPVRDREGAVQGLVLLLSDLTRRKEQEAEQARRERLAVVGELSGNLAHEIRNSLKPVVGSIELLASEVPQEGVTGELIKIILRESESLETFLRDFLIFTRDKTLTMEEIDLEELMREEIASLSHHPARRAGVGITTRVESAGMIVRTDGGALRGIVRNLLLNALEATPEGTVEVSWRRFEDGFEVAIEDSGGGLPEGDPEGLFEPFRSNKPGGTGLGLSIARKLARRLGGDVVLEPRESAGARARLFIRRCPVMQRAA